MRMGGIRQPDDDSHPSTRARWVGTLPPMTIDAIRVLDADPDLGDVLDEGELDEARRALVAPAMTLAKGDWSPRQAVPEGNGHLGLLVTQGILCREVAIADTVCAELVGPGDLLRPWDGGGVSALVASDVRWRVLQETRFALLGRRFTITAARWPSLTSAFVARSVSRSQGLAVSAAITCTIGLDRRLVMLFSHLSDRWGKVRPDGLMVPVPMTHELIGRLIGACRPSVSTALKQLEREGLIVRLGADGWLLRHPPLRLLQGTGGEARRSAAPSPAVAATA